MGENDNAIEWARERLQKLRMRRAQLRNQLNRLDVEEEVVRSMLSDLGENIPERGVRVERPRFRSEGRGVPRAPRQDPELRRAGPPQTRFAVPKSEATVAGRSASSEPRPVPKPRATLLPPKEAVMQVLAKRPGELTRKEVVDEVMEVVETDAKKPRNVVYTVLRRMEKRGEVEEDEPTERMWLTEMRGGKVAREHLDLDDEDENEEAPDSAEAEGGSS